MGDSFGRAFRITTWGESHGGGVGVVIDGCPAGLELDEQDIQHELDRRKPGQSRITTQRKESDTARIVSGVFEGRTLGTAIFIGDSTELTVDAFIKGENLDFEANINIGDALGSLSDLLGGGVASSLTDSLGDLLDSLDLSTVGIKVVDGTGRLDAADRLAQKSLGIRPANAVAAHSVTHVFFAKG